MSVKVWYKVKIKGYWNKVFKVALVDDREKDFAVVWLSGRFPFSSAHKVKDKTINIWWYNCEIFDDKINNKVTIKFKNYECQYSYYWNMDDFIKNNETMIGNFFNDKIDKEVKWIMNEFTNNFSITVEKLKKVVLPNTKDLLINDVLDVFKNNIVKVANLFSDSSIKSVLLNLFK